MTDDNASIGTAALAWARQGVHVFPVHSVDGGGNCTCGEPDCKDVGKHPHIGKWQDAASADDKTVKAWWRKWPDANIGAIPGKSGHVVIDFDPWKPDDAAKLARLEHEHGALAGKVMLSGAHEVNGEIVRGRHHWMRLPTEVGKSKWDIDGIEVKHLGSYVLLPPSRHKSGTTYEEASDDLLPEASVAPDWVLPPSERPSERAQTTSTRDLTGLPIGKRTLLALKEGLPAPDPERNEHTHRDVAVGIARNLIEAGTHQDVARVTLWWVLDNEASAQRPGDPWTPRDAESIVASVVRDFAPDAGAHLPKDLDNSPAVIDLGVIMERGPERLTWLFEPLVAEAKSTLLAGGEGTGKSMIALSVAAVLVRRGLHVAYLDEELGQDEVASRVLDLDLTSDQASEFIHYAYELGPTYKDMPRVVEWCRKHDIRLVVFDSASDFYVSAGANENSNPEVAEWYKKVANHLRKFGVASLVIEHSGHEGDRARGARAKSQKADLPYFVTLPDGATFDDVHETYITATRVKRRFKDLPPEESVTFRIGGSPFLFERAEHGIHMPTRKTSPIPDLALSVLTTDRWLETNQVRTRMNDEAGDVVVGEMPAVRKHLNALRKAGKVERDGADNGKTVKWRLAQPEQED